MTPGAARARARGDLPRAPGFTALAGLTGGLAALLLAAADAGPEISTLAEAAFGALDAPAAWGSAERLLWRLGLAPLFGALAGLVLAQAAMGAMVLRARARVRPSRAPRFPLWAAALALAAPAVALLLLPRLLPVPDAGRALLFAPAVGVLAALALLLPGALVQRSRAQRRWQRRVAPEPPPRRDPDELAPEVRAALRRAASEER